MSPTSTDIRRFSLRHSTEQYLYRTPMKFGGRIVTDVTVLNVHAELETGRGVGHGLGSMTMGVAWAWPGDATDGETKLQVVLALARRISDAYAATGFIGHPFDLCMAMHDRYGLLTVEECKNFELVEPIPPLATLLAASAVEAAIFDAYGHALGISSYAALDRQYLPDDLSRYLGESYAGVHLSDVIRPRPAPFLPLYHLVGALDPLTASDVATPIGDGLPEHLGDWIERDGLTHLKIKLDGADAAWDLERVLAVYRVAVETSPSTPWQFSLDFNERCDGEAYVLRLLAELQKQSAAAYDCVAYIEQPTHRDLNRPPVHTMHAVAEQLPVVIDESLIDIASLRRAIELGYSGVALKACKGHASALLAAAVAVHEGYYLCVQDLTCVGASLLHSASLAAHIPGVAAIESNGRQYSPAANAGWLDRFGPFFEVRNGQVPTEMLDGPGLGYTSRLGSTSRAEATSEPRTSGQAR